MPPTNIKEGKTVVTGLLNPEGDTLNYYVLFVIKRSWLKLPSGLYAIPDKISRNVTNHGVIIFMYQEVLH